VGFVVVIEKSVAPNCHGSETCDGLGYGGNFDGDEMLHRIAGSLRPIF